MFHTFFSFFVFCLAKGSVCSQSRVRKKFVQEKSTFPDSNHLTKNREHDILKMPWQRVFPLPQTVSVKVDIFWIFCFSYRKLLNNSKNRITLCVFKTKKIRKKLRAGRKSPKNAPRRKFAGGRVWFVEVFGNSRNFRK